MAIPELNVAGLALLCGRSQAPALDMRLTINNMFSISSLQFERLGAIFAPVVRDVPCWKKSLISR